MATNTQTPRHKLTIIEDELILELASVIVADGGGTGVPGEGDMLAATYDPQGIEGDAFAMANMTEGADAKVMTAAERNAIAALGTASTREADQNLRTTDAVEFDTVTAETVNLHTAAFDTTNGGPTTLGEMAWDSVDGTLDIQADGGVKIPLVGGMIRVRNVSGAVIAKGAPLVYVGTNGASTRINVRPWIGESISDVRQFLGFAAGAIADNVDGYSVWFGKIKEIATDGGAELWDDGDIIYAIPGASATLSNIRPTSGDYVTAAVVINAGSGTSGSIFVRPTFDSISSVSGVSYGDLDDAGTVDLPTVNTPLATALGLKADASSLATVATTGAYADLTGTPSLVVNFADLGDATTVDLPTVNTPLATALAGKAATSHTHVVAEITDFPSLANIATSGSWTDLSDVPTTFTPSAHTHVVADITDFPTLALVATSGAYADLIGTPSLATVATSGSYADLTGTPTIPSDNQVSEYLVDDGIHTLTSSAGVVTPDAANGRSQKFPLTENVTDFNPPVNLADGQSMLIQLIQDSPPRTMALDPSWVIMGAGVAADIGALTAGQYAWLSVSRCGTDYLISITTEA